MLSNNKTSLDEQVNDAPEYVTITALELAQLKDAAMQWQKARSGIERMLKLEPELIYLVDHIDIINTKALAQSRQNYRNPYGSSIELTAPNLRNNNYANVPTKVERPIRQYNNRQTSLQNSKVKKIAKAPKDKKVFALQVASLNSHEGVVKQWKQINQKASPLFKDKIATNIEKTEINNKTYYRLKLGEYHNFKSAEDDCEVFKFYKVDCFVSNYTEGPIIL